MIIKQLAASYKDILKLENENKEKYPTFYIIKNNLLWFDSNKLNIFNLINHNINTISGDYFINSYYPVPYLIKDQILAIQSRDNMILYDINNNIIVKEFLSDKNHVVEVNNNIILYHDKTNNNTNGKKMYVITDKLVQQPTIINIRLKYYSIQFFIAIKCF